MSTTSERLAVQVWFERHLGCKAIGDWPSYKGKLEALSLDTAVIDQIEPVMRKDAVSLYERAVISFASAFVTLRAGQTGWAHVKFYYSTYYAIRSILTIKGHCLVRNKCWYHAFLPNKPLVFQKLNTNKHRNDHDTALNIYNDFYEKSDWLLSNKIDGLGALQWLMELRNDSNYRSARFPDPFWLRTFEPQISEEFQASVEKLCGDLLEDESKVKYFMPEYAWLSIPLVQLLNASEALTQKGVTWAIEADRVMHLDGVLGVIPPVIRGKCMSPQVAVAA